MNSITFVHIQKIHPKQYERYVAMRDESRSLMNQDRIEYEAEKSAEFAQDDFNRIVMDFMIKGMHPATLLDDPSFDSLLNGMIEFWDLFSF